MKERIRADKRISKCASGWRRILNGRTAYRLTISRTTLSRVARRLEEEGSIEGTTPARYCYIVARFVFLEHHREAKLIGADPSRLSAGPAKPDINEETRTTHLNCLEACLRKLDEDQRELIIEYYRGDQRAKIDHRRSLAARLGLGMNAVTIRACRIRDRLEGCVRTCSATQGDDRISGIRLYR